MCVRLRGVADMSRVTNRASTIAAALAIVVLVILLLILWTGFGNGHNSHPRASSIDNANENRGFRADSQRRVPSMPINEQNRMQKEKGTTRDMTTKFNIDLPVSTSFNEENFTNEVLPERRESAAKFNDSTIDILPSMKGDLEYVRPMKISENQYEDPPDEFSTSKRHHSGHFRHSKAEVWDPHPQYEFNAFGRKFRIRLAHDSSFVSPDIQVTHISENTTWREHAGHQRGCLYSGSIDGDPTSVVTVSLCHGMTGSMRTSTGSYFIKPAEQWREDDKDSVGSPLQHVFYRKSTTKLNSNNVDVPDDLPSSYNCGVIDYDSEEASPMPLTDNSSANKIYVGKHVRRRRSLTEKTSLDDSREDYDENPEYKQFIGHSGYRQNFLRHENRYQRYYAVEERRNYPHEDYARDSEMESDPFVTWRPRRALPHEYFIEIMVVADAKMVEYHGNGLISYILVLMSTVSRIYKDHSIGNPISISVMKIMKTNEVFGTRHSGSDGISAAEMLKRFCHWQKTHNPDEPSPEHHDAALLLTRENLCHNPGQKRCDTLGLAELGRMCSPSASCAIVQDNGLAAAFTIAHEIGHVLNMPHDDDSKCTVHNNRSKLHNVMSRMLDDNTFPWEWSKCSRHYVTEFLEDGYGNCLLDEPSKMMEKSDAGRLPGEDYSENKQCELVFGPGSRICSHMVDEVCRRLWCTAPMWDDRQQCHTQHMPWADGTPCGSHKWCHRGECVSRRNLEPIDGQWGEWGNYGECSRTCGGGVKKKYRECDNPPPQNGGNYCVGERVKYRSCGTKECSSGSSHDFREEQCAAFNNNNHNIQNLARDVKWRAKYTRILPEERCKLYCQVESNQYYMLRDKVVDGTPCGPDTFHICVNGHCKAAGCDHVLNSTAELDTCGVCRGDNSTCQRITGSYNSSIYGYTRVAKIPAGSSYIDIRQHGWKGSQNDSNYLALRLGEGGKYILNGNFIVMHQKVIVYPGVTIEYSGPESVIERLNSSRPIGTDLILEILSVDNVYPPQITYEYTVPKKILTRYTWVLTDWSDCNRMCQGTKYRKVECRSTEYKDVVSDDYCRIEEKPREESQTCNNHCTLQWQVTSVSECSSHCGPGTRSVTTRCMQTLSDGHVPRPLPAHVCSHLERPAEHEKCMGSCEDAHWSYGEWGPCSVSCGGGVQIRSATCVESKGRTVSNDMCDKQEKHLKRQCGQETCPKWYLGDWNACSVTCGKGVRRRAYWCHIENQVVSSTYCGLEPSGIEEVCNADPCHQWHAGNWSPCSVTCGEGTKRRKVVCKNVDGRSSNECSPSEKPKDRNICTLKPCPTTVSLPPITYSSDPPREDSSQYDNEIDSNGITFRSAYKWRTGEFGPCSKSCNGGVMMRVVKCMSTVTETNAPDDYCDASRKPPETSACNRQACGVWNTGEWSQCDVKCGHGFHHRQVRCQSPRGEELPDKECPASEKPRQTRKCQRAPCVTTTTDIVSKHNLVETNIVRRWRVSNWTPCSKSCGTGIKTRRVECTMRRSNHGSEIPVKDEQCSKLGQSKPKTQRPCQRAACDYTWQESPWLECSAECGEGIQRRAVNCHRVNQYGWIDPTPTHGCPMNLKPPDEQVCKSRECTDRFYWKAGPWRKCSHPCGRKGRQNRKLFCHDRSGKKVPRYNCPAAFKPQRKRRCNQKRCGPVTCLEAQKRYKSNKDGEYGLLIGGKNMSIYCHNMNTAEPHEYLTLPAGDRENYAEIYDKRLLDPYSCPFDGRRNDNCQCVLDRGTISGRTMFRRVRIDPIKLHIIADDYTFSWTNGAKRVEYGEAGDCYSLLNCPQGRFSINLKGTLLKLSSQVTWVTSNSKAFQSINRLNDQHVVGKCGGYCGFCTPKTDLKLDVLPP